MDKMTFITLETKMVSGVIWVYGWLDRGRDYTENVDGKQHCFNPKWYKLTSLEVVNAEYDQDKIRRA